MPYSPNLIDAASTDTLGAYQMAPNAYGRATSDSPFVYPGRPSSLYVCLFRDQVTPADFTINVYRSDDRGVAWTMLDHAHAPVRGSGQNTGGCHFDGHHTVTVAYTDGSTSSVGTIRFQDFDLATETWGSIYGTGGSPSVRIVNQIVARGDGTRLVFFNRTFGSGRVEGLSAAVYFSGAWGSPFAIDTNLGAGFVSDSRVALVLDPLTGVTHTFTRCTDLATFSTQFWFYQAVKLDDSLGSFHQFATGDMDCFANGNGNPIIVGANLLFGVMNHAQTKPTLCVGTPLAAPVFSVMADPGIDPSCPFSSMGKVPVLAATATTIYALIAIRDSTMTPTELQLRLCQTTNLASPISGWSETTIWDYQGALFEFFNTASLGAYARKEIFVTAGLGSDTADQETLYWFGVFVPILPFGNEFR